MTDDEQDDGGDAMHEATVSANEEAAWKQGLLDKDGSELSGLRG